MKESVLRTLVPIVYALLIKAGFASLGVDDVTLQAVAALIVTGILYVALRIGERYKKEIGWRLLLSFRLLVEAMPSWYPEFYGRVHSVMIAVHTGFAMAILIGSSVRFQLDQTVALLQITDGQSTQSRARASTCS